MMDDHPDTPSTTNPYVSEPKGYALSGKIMVIAIIVLFTVVLIMICVHIYARCYILRRRRRRTHLIFYHKNPSNVGLDPNVLKSLPIFTFSKLQDTAEMVLECAVCLSELEAPEKVRLLSKCKHYFHVECIDMWFHSHSTCPLCRSPVELDDDTESAWRRKAVEVPRRSKSFCLEETGPSGLKSPRSRILRILSLGKENKSPGGCDLDVELGPIEALRF